MDLTVFKLIIMDITRALPLWSEMGNTTNDYNDENDNYVIDFINKVGEVVGWIRVYPGQGIKWSYPEELMKGAQ
jgi:hypothetical protein